MLNSLIMQGYSVFFIQNEMPSQMKLFQNQDFFIFALVKYKL